MLSPIHAKHYLFEVVREAELVQYAYEKFQRAAEEWIKAEHTPEPDGKIRLTSLRSEREMLAALEGVISGFARISLFFFPQGQQPRSQARAQMLRELVRIEQNHPIANRELRNHWMHMDERLDAALQTLGTVPVGYYLDMAQRVAESQRRDTLRLIDPTDEKVYVLGQVYSLADLARVVEQVGNLAALAIVDTPDG